MTVRTGLPKGWARTAIEELFFPLDDQRTLHQGWSPQCDEEPAGVGQWGVLRTTAIQPGGFFPEHNKRLPSNLEPRPRIVVEPGDILITCAGPRSRCGVPCLVRRTGPKLMMSGKMYRFRVLPALMSAAFVEAFLLSADTQSAIDRMKTGGSDSGLNLTHERFRQLPVLVAPIVEQHRIVEAIDSHFTCLDAAVDSLERVQAKLKAYRASVLKAAVEGRLVPTEASLARAEKRDYEPAEVLLARILKERRRRWEEAELAKLKARDRTPKDEKWKAKYPEPMAPDTSTLPELPEGWCWATVEGISTKVVDGVHKKPDYVSSGVPFVTVKNLTAGPGIDLKSLRYITIEDHQKFIARANPERGDLLVSKDGTLGVIRAVRTKRVFSIFVSVAMVKPVLISMSDYLELALSSPLVQDQMVPKGSGLQHIHLEDLRRDCLPIPPLAEQSRILEAAQRHISVVDWVEEGVARNLAKLSRFRQAVLKWAFEGKLVDQDPTDEPAERLLARIRAERAAGSPTKKTPPRHSRGAA